MAWFQNLIPDRIKKGVVSSVIKHYFSHFIGNDITGDQFSLDITNGRGTARNISLAVEALNEVGKSQNWPVEVVAGHIEEIAVTVPWYSLLKESPEVELCGLTITVQPKQREEDATSMIESMWNSMPSSVCLAEELIKADPEYNDNDIDGVDSFTKTFESLVRHVKVKLSDLTIQIRHLPKGSKTGVGINFKVDSLEYSDKCSTEKAETEKATNDLDSEEGEQETCVTEEIMTKNISINGIKFETVEFSSERRQVSIPPTSNQDEMYFQMSSSSYTDNSNEIPECDQEDKTTSFDHTILCGKCLNSNQVTLHLRQLETFEGPKVSMEFNLGSLISFLSPRQLHILLELADGFLRPELEDNSNILNKNQPKPKPMTNEDFALVEAELAQLTHNKHLQEFNLFQGHGWSTGNSNNMADSTESEYQLMRQPDNEMFHSMMSGLSSSMETSSVASTMISSVTDCTSKKHERKTDANPSAEIIHFDLHISTLAVILLHDDYLNLNGGNDQILVRQMQSLADQFFDSLNPFTFSGIVKEDFEPLHQMLSNKCHWSHLRFLASPLRLKGNETTTSNAFSISGELSANKLELNEFLYNKECNKIPIINFEPGSSEEKPDLAFKYKFVQKTGSRSKKQEPKREISAHLRKCSIDFDLSLVDRISSLVSYPTICEVDDNSNQETLEGSGSSLLDLKISCPLVKFQLRFPIPDFRPATDMSKMQWWERNIRPDYISLNLRSATFYTANKSDQTFCSYTVECKILDVVYYETENSAGLHIGRCGTEEAGGGTFRTSESKLTRLNIKLFPKNTEDDEIIPEPMFSSLHGVLEDQNKPEPGPFKASRTVHESDTPHEQKYKDDSKEKIITGDKEELNNFIKSTRSNAKTILDVTLPYVSLQLTSKHVYELIYNRISNDLLLWTPQAPKPNVTGSASCAPIDSEYVVANSGLPYDSEGSDDDSPPNTYFSTYAVSAKQSLIEENLPLRRNGQSDFVLSLNIGKGLVSLNPPARDSSDNVIPGQQAELVLKVNDASVFTVSGYKNAENLGYVCVQVNNAKLYHCDIQPTPGQSLPLRPISAMLSKQLVPTIYKSDPKSFAHTNNKRENRDMLTLAVKIETNKESNENDEVKSIILALGLNEATLNQRMTKQPISWIFQLIDFFKVLDYPIPGYTPKPVMTELHLHIWNSTIDYRPLYLPLRSAISIGEFSICAHVGSHNTQIITLLLEDCGLYLSDRGPPTAGVPSKIQIDLRKDYVNVLEVTLFELSVRNTEKSNVSPLRDLRLSADTIHIRTCLDTQKALQRLIIYCTENLDCNMGQEPTEIADVASSSSSTMEETEELINLRQRTRTLSKSQQQQISELIEDAMEDNSVVPDAQSSVASASPHLFNFPFQTDAKQTSPSHSIPQVTADLGVFGSNYSQDDDLDDFCVLENASMKPSGSSPEVTLLDMENEGVLIENHLYAPTGKKDVLAAPKGFPIPAYRFTLCEMNIIWHMYGGHDFNKPEDQKDKVVTFVTGTVKYKNDTLTYVRTMPDESENHPNWIQRGGAKRDHNMLIELQLSKVKFSQEKYPNNGYYVKRQVLAIHDVEIRDRLKSSNINKFLYRYNLNRPPKQSNPNMVLVKALYVRPDPQLSRVECDLKISLEHIRLNIDQDCLFFIKDVIKELSNDDDDEGGEEADEAALPSKSEASSLSHAHEKPVLTISVDDEEAMEQQAKELISENLILLESKYGPSNDISNDEPPMSAAHNDSPTFFRHVEFTKDVIIRIDYEGKRVDMSLGPIAGLILGLSHLRCSEIHLKRIVHRHGILGVEKLMIFLFQMWLSDIKKHQLAAILEGVGPMKAIIQLVHGFTDLFWLPVEQYQKDGRVFRGIQRGANSFATRTVVSALELFSRFISTIQVFAEFTYDMLSPGPSIRVRRLKRRKIHKRRHYQPQDIREGIMTACQVMREGFGETASSLVQVAIDEKEQKGITGAIGAVIRQMPPTLVRPVVIATEATNNLLEGLQGQLLPEVRREANEKWRNDAC